MERSNSFPVVSDKRASHHPFRPRTLLAADGAWSDAAIADHLQWRETSSPWRRSVARPGPKRHQRDSAAQRQRNETEAELWDASPRRNPDARRQGVRVRNRLFRASRDIANRRRFFAL